MVSVNEPWDASVPAPLLYVGRTEEARLALFARFDLDAEAYASARALAQEGASRRSSVTAR